MSTFWKDTLLMAAMVFAAMFIGGAVNTLFVNLGGILIEAPEGADITTMKGLKASIHLFKPINFLFPFLAHALGVLISSFLATKFLKKNQIAMVAGIVVLNFIGGLGNSPILKMRTLIFSFLLIFGIQQNTYSQDFRDEADTFAMNMVRMLVNQNCEAYPALFDDTVYMLQKSQALVKNEMGSKISIFCKAAIRDKSMTMESYLANFNHELLDAEEMKTKKDLFTLIQAHPSYTLKENDYLFIGYHHKTDDYMKYILDDPFCVIFRKYDDGFRIVMLAGN